MTLNLQNLTEVHDQYILTGLKQPLCQILVFLIIFHYKDCRLDRNYSFDIDLAKLNLSQDTASSHKQFLCDVERSNFPPQERSRPDKIMTPFLSNHLERE